MLLETGISAIIPTYRRGQVLLDTIVYLFKLEPAPAEILIVDQTPEHEAETTQALAQLESAGRIRWIRLPEPSITRAMNTGLKEARGEVVLFLDDDIIPDVNLIAAHASAHAQSGCHIVAGQVLQPGEAPLTPAQESGPFRFRSNRSQRISEIMGGNFSIKRELALRLGGFDENFVHVAYRFEAEFAERALAAGENIFFEPQASIRHLKATSGGTRAFGHHLTTIKPSHAVGEYYYLLRSKRLPRRVLHLFTRPLRAVRTKHHLTHPWWIPPTLVAEGLGFFWAAYLALRGPRLVNETAAMVKNYD
jgi:GT2 family glycosyltransferase